MNRVDARLSAETRGRTDLTTLQKMIGWCLLIFYIAMIGVTIATLKYTDAIPSTSAVPINFN